jgi:hypothetical protein
MRNVMRRSALTSGESTAGTGGAVCARTAGAFAPANASAAMATRTMCFISTSVFAKTRDCLDARVPLVGLQVP